MTTTTTLLQDLDRVQSFSFSLPPCAKFFRPKDSGWGRAAGGLEGLHSRPSEASGAALAASQSSKLAKASWSDHFTVQSPVFIFSLQFKSKRDSPPVFARAGAKGGAFATSPEPPPRAMAVFFPSGLQGGAAKGAAWSRVRPPPRLSPPPTPPAGCPAPSA